MIKTEPQTILLSKYPCTANIANYILLQLSVAPKTKDKFTSALRKTKATTPYQAGKNTAGQNETRVMHDSPTTNGASPQVNGALHHTPSDTVATKENIASLLANDRKVKVAGVDADGILRGKIMSKDKFLSSVENGFAMSSAVFGWDMHDELYSSQTTIATADDGYCDFVAHPDLASFRRLPFEENIPFFLVSFSNGGKSVSACGRSMIKSLGDDLAQAGFRAMAGGTISMERPLLGGRG